MLDTDGDVDLHVAMRKIKCAKQRQRTVMQRIVDRAAGGFGVILAIQVIASAKFENKTCHAGSPAAASVVVLRSMSNDTNTAAWAMIVLFEAPAVLFWVGLAMSNPPWVTVTAPVP